jgi:hypothetical protein
VVAICEARVVQVLPLRPCNETVCLVNGAPFDVSWPVIEKDFLTWAVGGAEIVRVVGVFVGVAVGVFVVVTLAAVGVFVGVAVEVGAGVAVEVFASTAGVALQNNNAQTTNSTATTITTLFSAHIFFPLLSIKPSLVRQSYTEQVDRL